MAPLADADNLVKLAVPPPISDSNNDDSDSSEDDNDPFRPQWDNKRELFEAVYKKDKANNNEAFVQAVNEAAGQEPRVISCASDNFLIRNLEEMCKANYNVEDEKIKAAWFARLLYRCKELQQQGALQGFTAAGLAERCYSPESFCVAFDKRHFPRFKREPHIEKALNDSVSGSLTKKDCSVEFVHCDALPRTVKACELEDKEGTATTFTKNFTDLQETAVFCKLGPCSKDTLLERVIEACVSFSP